jgi:hypothetical protein
MGGLLVVVHKLVSNTIECARFSMICQISFPHANNCKRIRNGLEITSIKRLQSPLIFEIYGNYLQCLHCLGAEIRSLWHTSHLINSRTQKIIEPSHSSMLLTIIKDIFWYHYLNFWGFGRRDIEFNIVIYLGSLFC